MMEGNDAGSARANSSVTLQDVEDGNTNDQQVQSRDIRRRYFEKCIPLREAAMKGDWRAAEKLMASDGGLWRESITVTQETIFHIAAGAANTNFFKKLLDLYDTNGEALELTDGNGNTVFYHAVTAGAKAIAEMMLDRKQSLLTIRCKGNMTPLYYAALFGRGEMTIFLYNKMKDQITELGDEERTELGEEERKHIFFACMNAHLYDVALELLKDRAELANARRTGTQDTALHFLARHPSAFRSTIGVGMLSGIMKRIKSPQTIGFQLAKCLWNEMKLGTDVKEMIRSPKHLLFEAVENGNFPLVEMMIHSYPDLAWESNKQFPTIFHAAIKYRRSDIFYLIHDIGSIKDVINAFKDDEDNNMLHLAAKIPDQSRLNLIPGAALQMQQELLWYKEVKKIMEPEPSESVNNAGKTPEVLFMEEHKSLLKDGERWMKKTSESCTLVATLIATVVFATAFTMPGGSDQIKGTAVFLNEKASEITFLKQNPFIFRMFAISTTVALAASITSIMFFLAILISPYSQKEFLSSLPLKLVIGFFMLLISMVSMMFAFCIAYMLAYAEKSKSIPWTIVAINIVPIFLFIVLLGPLFWNVCCSTHIRKLLCRQKKLMSY